MMASVAWTADPFEMPGEGRMRTRAASRMFRAAALIALTAGIVVLAVRHFHIKHFDTVRTDVLYRSGQPVGADWERLYYKYHIRTVVNLRSENERSQGDWYDIERQKAAEYGMTLIDLPMEPSTPAPEQARRFLAAVTDRANWPVLVHCEVGRDRTGTLVALYRMQVQGWSLEQALADMGNHDGHPDKPEIVEFLRTFAPAEPAATAPEPTIDP